MNATLRDRPHTDSERLFARYRREGDRRDRDELIERHLPLARYIAHKHGRRREDRDDLEQVAAIALIKAIDRFDPGRGVAFTSYAMPTIVGELKRHYRDHGWSVRVPRGLKDLAVRVELAVEELTIQLGCTPTIAEIAARCDETVESVLEARAAYTAHFADSLDSVAGDDDEAATVQELIGVEDHGYAHAEAAVDADRLLMNLPARDREIVCLRFTEDLMQREIAERFGISQMQVSRILTRSIEALRCAS